MSTVAKLPAEFSAKPAARRIFPGLGSLAGWARLCIVGTAIVVILCELAGVRWPLNCLTPFTPQWGAIAFLGAVLLRIVAMIRKRLWRVDGVLMAAGVMTAIYAGAITFGFVPWRTVPPAAYVAAADDRPKVKLLIANVHTNNPDHQSILDLIAFEQPDVVLLMELNNQWTEDLSAVLNDTYPVRRTMPDESGNFGFGVWSRLPAAKAEWVLQKDEDRFNRLDVPQLDATLIMKDAAGQNRSIRFVGLHPLPPMNRKMSAARDAVLARTADTVAADKSIPTIVAGDLNITRYCRMIRRLTVLGGLRDAASNLRFSWPNTWSKPIFAIRIDHILVTDHWRVVETRRGPAIGSDHMPIITTLQLTADAPANAGKIP
ncbi:MAG TPA: endonuclease/exonuclease/phosphatase family protein [Tepidisphaeraceae bacterium]